MIENLRREINETVLRYRAIDRILKSELFEDIYNRTSKDGQVSISYKIKRGDLQAVKDFVKENRGQELGEMSYRDLRELAKKNNIYRWSRLDKIDLIQELSKLKEI